MLSDESRLGPEAAAARPRPERSAALLLSDLASEAGMLVRQEIALFKAELHQKLVRLGQGVGALAAGGLMAFSGWLALLAAAVLGLSNFVAPWIAALIVGVVALTLGAGLLFFGRSRIGAAALIPRRTLSSLREDAAWIRERLS
jgi:Putative Actinobacterial Holin-X, holin superfamily III